MIQVRFKPPKTKRWREWRTKCDCERATLEARKRAPYKIDEALYKACRDILFEGYANKCAYCEGRLYEQSAGLVEHFRPKGGVRDLNNRVVKIRRKAHSGYWWLAYEPSNLLPTCTMCNVYTRKLGGKGERFPLPENGFRATRPGEEKKEKPLLIHPGREDPSKHLDLVFDTGALKAVDDRGRTSIEVFGLNREALLEARREAARNATLSIREARRRKRSRKPPKNSPRSKQSNSDQDYVDQHLAGLRPYSLVWRKVNDEMSPGRPQRRR